MRLTHWMIAICWMVCGWTLPLPASAQGVSLPSLRATGPTPEVELLHRMSSQMRRIYHTDSTRAARRVELDAALNRLALSAVAEGDIESLARDSLTQPQRDSILRRYFLDDGDTLQLRAYQRFLASTSNSDTADDVDEYETGELLRNLRAQERDPVIRAQLDTLSMVARAVVIQRKLRTRWRFPVRSREQAIAFWRQPGFSTLNIGFVAGTGGQGVAYTELASPFLHFVRISINTVLAAAEEEDAAAGGDGTSEAAQDGGSGPDDAAIMRFVNGGGLLNVAFSTPLLYWSLAQDKASVMVLAHPRFGGTLPALGASERDSTLVYDAGAELHLLAVDAAGGVGMFLLMRGGLAGGSGRFGELLGAESNHFGYTTLTVGLSLGNRYLLNVGRTLVGPDALRDRGWQLGLTALRGPAGP
jgi:hypothetical protein